MASQNKKPAAPANMNNGGVNQHKRLAMGFPVTGKTLPAEPKPAKKTPA